jgi:hypothetical protein
MKERDNITMRSPADLKKDEGRNSDTHLKSRRCE